MTDVVPLAAVQQPAAQTPAALAPAVSGANGHGGLFHEILSDLNPLQYIPVVGTVYRAITGDEGNSTLRNIAAFGTSFALGGPVGVGITAAEEVTGIDPTRIAVNAVLHLFHLGHSQAVAAKPAATDPANEMDTALAQVQPFPQLPAGHAYDAETLNLLELQRLRG